MTQVVQVELVGDDVAQYGHVRVKGGSPCTAIARKLQGQFAEDTQIEFYRGTELCGCGVLGKLAARITVETSRGLRWMKYRAFPGARDAHQGQD